MASRHIPLDAAVIMSTVLEGILYGFSVLMFIGTIWIFTYKRRVRDINWPIAVVATLLLVLSTAHIVINIIYLEDGLVRYRNTFPGGPQAFFAYTPQATFLAKSAIYILQTLVGDGVVIYRCYVVWRSIWVIIIPCIMWCGVAGCSVCMVYFFSQASISEIENFFTSKLGHWVAAFLSSTLATNLLSTGLLAYRIWTIERKVSTFRTVKGRVPILRMLMDAAILYSAALCSSLISFALSNDGLFVVADVINPIISITFYMVFIRIAIRQNDTNYVSTEHVGGGTTDTERSTPQQHPLKNICRENDIPFLVA